jgi:GT2 family glycosyltransferase
MHSGIAVIVVNYNTADLLRACLQYLLAGSLDRPLQV